MYSKQEIEDITLKHFSFLKKEGFSQISIKRKTFITAIDFISKDIAVEIEIDWRDFDVFFLLVILENGRLPNGYYVSNGEKVRMHLQSFFEKIKAKGIPIEIPNLYQSSFKKKEHDFAHLVHKIQMFSNFLNQNIQLLKDYARENN